MRKTIVIDGKELHIIFGMTYVSWVSRYRASEEYWDVSFEDIATGAIEFSEEMWYCYINGRLFETSECV